MAGLSRTLAVDLNGLMLPTAVMVASGCAGTGRELGALVDLHKVGGVVSRSITLEARKGTPTPRIAETPSGIVWSTGLQNPGIDVFLQEELPRLARGGVPVIVSIAGGTMEEFVRLTSLLQGAQGMTAIETYLSGPDEELGTAVLACRPDRAAEIVGAVARMATVPVFAKLPPLLAEPVETARACVRAGAHGLTLIDAVPALGVDPRSLRPQLGGVTGWLSGPAVRPLALRAIHDVARELPSVPILGVGGVRTGEDAVEMLLAGAWAVQMGTATLVDPAAPVTAAQGIASYLKAKGLASPADVRGRLRVPTTAAQEEAP
ncbi:MAG: dihydroorotate dehydrogenase [Actinobacteria bacterium]|nr:dihydroorotate dehydrogenase [Actinomycetota bacterium]